MKKLIYLAVAFTIILTGCSIKQEFSFNDDYSGHMSNSIDFSMMMAFMGEESETEENPLDSIEIVYKETAEKLKDVNGISNVEMNWTNDHSVLVLSYKFDDILSLNKALQRAEFLGDDKESNGFFTQKRRKITYHTPKFDLDSLKDNEEMAESGEFFSFNLKFNFTKKIKKVNNKKMIISDDKNSAELKSNLNELIEGELKDDIIFKVK